MVMCLVSFVGVGEGGADDVVVDGVMLVLGLISVLVLLIVMCFVSFVGVVEVCADDDVGACVFCWCWDWCQWWCC